MPLHKKASQCSHLSCAASARFMNIAIMHAFVRLREVIAAHKDLAARIETLD